MFPLRRLKDAIARFTGKRIVVVGDLIADEYLYGKPARISREAPVLILRFTDREVRLGGAANAAHNVHALGATVLPVGLLGQDGAGAEVHALFHRAGMSTDGISREAARPTPVKTRIMAGSRRAASAAPPRRGYSSGSRRWAPRPMASSSRTTATAR